MGPGSRPGRREIVVSAPRISSIGFNFQTALQTYLRDLAASSARGLLSTSCPQKIRRAQGRPGARCTRGLVCKVRKERAHEHTGSAGAFRPSLRSGFTAYSVLSPATNSSCHRRCRLDGSPSPVGPIRHRQLDTSNGCQDHTVLPYASAPFVLRAVFAHGKPPCEHFPHARRCRVHRSLSQRS